MATDCPEFWRIEGNVKRHLRRLKSINNHFLQRAETIEEQQKEGIKRRMNTKALKKQEIEDEEIRQMIKHNLEHGGPEDIIDIIRKNQVVEEDEDEIGLHDHIYDSSNASLHREELKKRQQEESDLSEIYEVEEDTENGTQLKKTTTFRKSTMSKAGEPNKFGISLKKDNKASSGGVNRKNFPAIDIAKMSTLHHETGKQSRVSEHSKRSKKSKASKLSK